MNFGNIQEVGDAHAPAQRKMIHESKLLKSKENLLIGVPKISKNVIVNKGCESWHRNYLLLHIERHTNSFLFFPIQLHHFYDITVWEKIKRNFTYIHIVQL